MLSQIVGNLLFILLIVLANGFFVAAEFAIVKVRSTAIDIKVKAGHRRAEIAKHIVEHLDAYLSATQLGITLTSLGLGWIGEPLLASMIREPLAWAGILSENTVHALAFLLSFGILTYIQITIGELAPRYLAIQYPEGTAMLVAYPLQLFHRVFRPFIWVLMTSSNFLLQILGIAAPGKNGEIVHSPEELELLVTEGARAASLNPTEQEMISSIFEFSTTTAKEIMVPRTEVMAIESGTPRETVVRIVTEEGYSRIPVYKDSLDNIIGIIYSKDLISLLEHRDLIVLQDILRPPYFIPESMKISLLMRELQERKIHMAIVVDEFGGTQGIVTMEDILEEIVGEIHDEYDEVMKDVEGSSEGSVLVNGRMSIHDFNEKFAEKFGSAIPDDPDYETLSGFLSKVSGHIPELNEEIHSETLQFFVTKKTARRIRQVKVVRSEHPVSGGDDDPASAIS